MLFYITYAQNFGINYTGNGVQKKVKAQLKVFEKNFEKAFYTVWNMQTAYLLHGNEIAEKQVAVTRREFQKVLIGWLQKYKVDKTYIRYPFADKSFIDLLKYQKENGIRSIIEVHTYPYTGGFYKRTQAVEDGYFSKLIVNYIDAVSIYSSDKEIWGIPTISLLNGVDMDIHRLQNKKEDTVLRMIAVAASFLPWNGFERLIEGVNHYIEHGGRRQLKIYFVGQGADENYYKSLVEKYHLNKIVQFCGQLDGKELDQVFDQADVAISSLGAYKLDINCSCPLKGAEYCARGLPMVCGYQDSRFPDDFPYILQVPNDATPIAIDEIINFYDRIALQRNYQKIIRNYAEENLSWDSIMRPVVDYYNR